MAERITSFDELDPGEWKLAQATTVGLEVATSAADVTHLVVRAPTGTPALLPLHPYVDDAIRVNIGRFNASGSLEPCGFRAATHAVYGTKKGGGVVVPRWAYEEDSPVWMWDQNIDRPTIMPAITLMTSLGQEIVLQIEAGRMVVVPATDHDLVEHEAVAQTVRLGPEPIHSD